MLHHRGRKLTSRESAGVNFETKGSRSNASRLTKNNNKEIVWKSELKKREEARQ
jgi:hypothetical protein